MIVRITDYCISLFVLDHHNTAHRVPDVRVYLPLAAVVIPESAYSVCVVEIPQFFVPRSVLSEYFIPVRIILRRSFRSDLFAPHSVAVVRIRGNRCGIISAFYTCKTRPTRPVVVIYRGTFCLSVAEHITSSDPVAVSVVRIPVRSQRHKTHPVIIE